MADNEGLDLVEISPTASPPVCKITDYKKFLYDRKKKLKEMKGVSGVHIMAIEWEEVVEEIVDRAGLLPRPVIS